MIPPHPIVQRLARAALHARGLATPAHTLTLGSVTLLPHQASAVRWLHHRITRLGGALLADPPGLGKTYVALAVANGRRLRPLVIAPASLRHRWRDAARETDVPLDFVSTERLSAPAHIEMAAPHFVIIDEAHHLRTPGTRRHQRTIALCLHAEVLLLTATPIHNRTRDLARITALFHLPPTRQSPASLRHLTLRRTPAQIHAAGLADGTGLRLPAVVQRPALRLPTRDTALPAAILALPSLHDAASEGHALLQLGVLHALRSSNAAARDRIRHRIAATIAIESAARANIAATPAVRRAWRSIGGDVQLAMPELLGTAAASVPWHLADRAARQRDALEPLLPMLDGDDDWRRATVLRRLARWSAAPAVAFTQFSATAQAFFRLLQHETGIAMLTGDQARIASGVIPRSEVLERLLMPSRSRHDAVRLLITTDVLSEGLSLSGVATVVHLDLPWTAARLDQRVGRAARIGASAAAVRVMTLVAAVPVAVHEALGELLARKRKAMRRFSHDDPDATSVSIVRVLAGESQPDHRRIGWLTVRSPSLTAGVLIALVCIDGRRTLVACDADGPRGVRADDWRALDESSPSVHVSGHIAALRRALHRWRGDRALRERVSDGSDHRLLARRLSDEALMRDRASRSGAAQIASANRRRQMLVTSPAALAQLAAQQSAVACVDARPVPASVDAAGRAVARGVRILCGVALLPGAS